MKNYKNVSRRDVTKQIGIAAGISLLGPGITRAAALTPAQTEEDCHMSKTISWNLQMAVREGRLDDARELMGEMVAATLEENGTQGYEWFISGDGAICHINERYVDSDAALVHLGNFGSKFADRFLACFEPTSMSVYGEPTEEARAALDGFGATYLGCLGGFNR
jgi:quinol monooxygenase YgiN